MANELLVVTEGYTFRINEDPEMITFKDRETGEEVPAVDRVTKQPKYRVGLIMKRITGPGEFKDKGTIIRVELAEQPDPDMVEGVPVSLRNLRVSLSTITADDACARKGHMTWAGFKYRAQGLSPAVNRSANLAA